MSRTTPPRPVEIAEVFPELASLARRTVRLHPRPGSPRAEESSVGGRLLWPSDEPWPVCEQAHGRFSEQATTIERIRRRREILTIAWSRGRQPGAALLTPDEAAVVDLIKETEPAPEGPHPLLPVAQVYLRDIPGLLGPDGADLLQVLWCPLGPDAGPSALHLAWRDSATVAPLVLDPPRPTHAEQFGNYVPEPCVLHPEQVIEYPSPHELDESLAERIYAWEERDEDGDMVDEDGIVYQYDLAVAPGWKIGGWAPWSFTDAWTLHCTECQSSMKPLLTIDSSEWDGGSGSWIPVEDQAQQGNVSLYPRASEPTMIQVGRGYSFQIYICPSSFEHPHQINMQ